MDKIGHQAVIQYLHIKGLTPKVIHNDMVATLQDNVPLYSMVKKWATNFKRDRDSLENGPRQEGLPLSPLKKSLTKSMTCCSQIGV